MPIEVVSAAPSWGGWKEEKTTTWRRARVTATLSRRSPPTRLSGPKFSGSWPFSLTEKEGEKKTTSRSAPRAFSAFVATHPPAAGAVQPPAQPVVAGVAQQRLDRRPLLGVERDHADRR